MGREFQMLPGAVWATREGDGEKITASTVRSTIAELQKHPNLPVSERINSLRLPKVTDQAKFELLMDRGCLEPLATMSFKILPTHILDKKEGGILNAEFATSPVGSGPYVYFGLREEDGKRYAVFKSNKSYGNRPGRSAPKIQEIRFVVAPPDPSNDLRDGKLDMVLDVPTAEMLRLRGGGLANVVVEETVPSRRIWMLAVNHGRPELGGEAGTNLRRAIAYAIDREEVLRAVFRAGTPNHRALNGPFPPDVWATPPAARTTSLFSKEYAQSRFKLAKNPGRPLKLKYVADPLSKLACEAIQKQIAQTGLDLAIEPEPRTALEMNKEVMG
jgi:ABC-type transport system substrate-binding protein